ncbi:MAG: aldolase [Acidimicrobiia bacterium]|nr:aldolase [Acidimicrobiia bacterium]
MTAPAPPGHPAGAAAVAAELVSFGALLAARGLAPGASGNLSVRLAEDEGGGYLLTQTGARLGALEAASLSWLDERGDHRAGDPPTKEVALHLAVYVARPRARAVVHLHSSWSVAVSCLDGLDAADVLPPLTAYYVMRVGQLPLVPYHPPGSIGLAGAVGALARGHHAVLLANHGPVVAGTTLDEAVAAAEELEETARLHLMLAGRRTRPLSAEQAAALRPRGAPGR